MTAVEAAYDHCARITQEKAANFRYAFMFLPRERKRAITAVYAFSRRLDDVSDEPGSVDDKKRRLDECRRDLARAFRGAVEEPVLVALADAIRAFDLPRAAFEDLVDGVEQDLTVTRYETFDELSEYCYRVASTVGLICVNIFGATSAEARAPAIDLGIAMQLTNILRDVKEDGERGRVYLPQSELTRFGGLTPDLLRFQSRRARSYFERGLRLLPLLPRRSRSCPAVLAAIYRALLDEIDADPERVLRERVSLPHARKVCIALKALVFG